MPGATFLQGDQVTLRTVEPEDYEFIHRHWNTPAIRHGFAQHSPRTKAQIEQFVEESENAIHFLPCCNGDPIGFLWLFRIDDVAGRAELGYWIASEEQGQGYATEAADLGLTYAFDDRGLHKVLARVFEWNEDSQRVLKKLGFQEEGRLREHYYVNGERVDARLYGILATER